jgi:hypothetical protein
MAVALLVAFLAQATWVLAGTTGSLSGQVTDETGAPVAGAAVKVASASQTATATTDGSGHFSFISLAPDTYVVTVTKQGYNPNSYPGVSVFADQSQTLALRLPKGLRQIAHVAATAAGSLVKSGTTADVYSVNSATQQTVMGSGGGYNLDSAYSAIYSQPGVTSQIGNYGFGQVYYIRGSSYSQVGYEYDGVPVNRAFDNYNANSLSSLGSQETEVYTGGSPAGGTSATLAGYINQVIKTGTFPGYAQGNFGIGTPGFYHKAGVEAGGATPDRLFSWYVGVQGSDQTYRTIDNQDGAGIANDGSSQYGLFSSFFNPLAGVFTDYYNGPWSTCGGAGNNGTGPVPKGSLENTALGVAVPVCNAYGPWQAVGFLGLPLVTQDRENVMNFHFGIPHKNDAGRDDVQALFYNFAYHQLFGGTIDQQGGLSTLNSNFAGWGGANGYAESIFGDGPYPGQNGPYSNLCGYNYTIGYACGTGASTLPYYDTSIFKPGTTFGQNAATAQATRYLSPSQGSYPPGTTIATNNADTTWNDATIIKLQYQKNFGSSAYVRIMGYSSYSDWLMSNANVAGEGFTGYGYGTTGEDYPSPDYELDTHTRGVQLQASDQINAQNLISFTGNYTTASVVRWNNQYYSVPAGVTNLVGKNGQCYDASTGALSNCLLSGTAGSYGNPLGAFGENTLGNNSCDQLPGSPACKAGASFQVTVPQGYGTLNTVSPQFSALALTDEWRPGDKWDINAGVRFESYVYDMQSTVNPEFNFWFNQAANAYCYDPKTGQPILNPLSPGSSPGSLGPRILPNLSSGESAGLCYNGDGTPYIGPSGIQARHPNGQNGSELYTNNGATGFSHPEWSPRVGGTYSFDPNDVLRFNYGRFTQPTQTAYEQYTNASGLGAAKFDYTYFWGLGFNTPTHDNPVQVSNNYDLSYEKHFANTDISMKLSPFYRWTTNQLVTISLGGNFASAINAATQKTAGVELALQKGDPSRNGLSGQLSYTFTSAKIKYSTLANGSNGIDIINNYISAFNKLTKGGGGSPYYCAPQTNNPNKQGKGPNGTNGGTQQYCGSGYAPIANPYYHEGEQGLLDRNGWYDTYPNEPPQATPDEGTSAISPNVFAGFLNFKHDKFTATVNAILNQGTSYGSPLSVIGLDPRTCSSNQSGIAGVAKQYAAAADFQSCGFSSFVASGNLAIPDPQTGTFDNVGQYREPWQLNVGMQFGYDVTPRIHLTATLANVLNTCFGGSAESWTAKYNPNNIVCAYTGNGQTYIGNQPGAGFFYGASGHDPANGTAGYPGVFDQPFQPLSGALPFQVYFNAQIRL